MKKSIQCILLGLALCGTVLAHATTPVFLITPITKLPSTIYAGQTFTTTYNVTNNTPYPLDGNGVVELPNGVTQVGGSCDTPFNLAPGANCTLTLQITANELVGNVRGGPKVCNTLSNPVYCARPSSGDELNLIKNNNLPPVFTISVTVSGLTASGLVVQNKGANALAIPAGTTFLEFAKPVVYGGDYVVTVAAQPTGLSCKTRNGIGTNVTANVTNVQVNCAPLSVGDDYGGGVVYRIDGNTAYIISPSDVHLAYWGPGSNPATSADNTFDTFDNTYTPLAGSSYPAAEACRNYAAGSGANTWFLPAQNEWPLIVADLVTMNSKSSTSGFVPFPAGSEYWSSTQENVGLAFLRVFSTSTSSSQHSVNKSVICRTRCVQALTF